MSNHFYNKIFLKSIKNIKMKPPVAIFKKKSKILWAWCESGTRTPGPGTWGPRDPGLPSKFKSGTWDPPKV